MNKKAALFVLMIFALAITATMSWQLFSNQNQNSSVRKEDTSKDTPAHTITPEINDFTASFEIFTNGTKRIFTAAM